MNTYFALKHAHTLFVGFSIALFVGRALAQFGGLDWRRFKPLRIAPHVIDTLLLATAIALAFSIRQGPITHGWLTAKVVGLVVYIWLGMLALRSSLPASKRIAAFIGALAVVAYIVAVAITKNPLPWQ